MTADKSHNHGIGLAQVLQATLFGLCLSGILAGSNILYGNVPWSAHIMGYVLVGLSISMFVLGSDHVWRSTMKPMVLSSRPSVVYSSRLPFWYIAGGMGYVVGLLLAKKIGLLTVFDIPVKSLFTFGGLWVMLLNVPYRKLMNSLVGVA